MMANSKYNRDGPAYDLIKYPTLGQESPTFNNQTSHESPRITINSKSSQNQSPQKASKYTFQEIKSKANSIVIEYIKNKLKISTFTEGIFNSLEQIKNSNNFTTFFQLLFNFIKDNISESSFDSNHDPLKEQFGVVIRSKQCKRLRIVRQQQMEKKKKSKSWKALRMAEKTNQQIKIELFNLKEENNLLQKKIANLIQTFKERKQFFTAEIRKLTQIISTSSKDMKFLAQLKTKEARIIEESHQKKRQREYSRARIEISSFSNKQELIRETNHSQRVKTVSPPPKNMVTISIPTENSTDMKRLTSVSSVQHIEQQRYEDAFHD